MRGTEFMLAFALGGVSLLIFHFAGAGLVLTFAGLWFLGALVGGVAATETVWLLKTA
jgi:hypothetical protein